MKRFFYAMRLLWLLLLPLLVYLLLVDLVFVVWEISGHPTGEEQELLLTAVAAAVASLPLGLWYRWERRTGGRKPAVRWLLAVYMVLSGLGACLIFNGLLYLLPLPREGYRQVSRVLYGPPWMVQLLAMGLVIPAAEELVFRGLGYGRLRRELSARAAILLSAVWFGLYHGNLMQGIYAGILGALAAVFYENTGCLWACWLFHSAANITAIVLTGYSK